MNGRDNKQTRNFSYILQKRAQLRANKAYKGNLNQGTYLPGLATSPYSFYDTTTYVSGLIRADKASVDRCADVAQVGKVTSEHVVGVKKGRLHQNTTKKFLKVESENESEATRIIIVGDMMVSLSGNPIELSEDFLAEIRNADIFVINIESAVLLSEDKFKRTNLDLKMSKAYLKHFVDQIKKVNGNIQIVFDIANNHSLDGNSYYTAHQKESALLAFDSENFTLLRTVTAIREIDDQAKIIGVHLAEEKFNSIPFKEGIIDCQLDPVAVIEKNGLRFGFIAFTDVLNFNAYNWNKRVVRTEDLPDDLKGIKQEYNLDFLYVIGHGNIEQCIYPTRHWRDIALTFAKNGADVICGHGPHVPLTNEVMNIDGEDKLIVHSVGNLFGPTKLTNTGLNSLLKLKVKDRHIINFSIVPIQTSIKTDEATPYVDIVHARCEKRNIKYRLPYERLQLLYPYKKTPAEYQNAIISMDADNGSQDEAKKRVDDLTIECGSSFSSKLSMSSRK